MLHKAKALREERAKIAKTISDNLDLIQKDETEEARRQELIEKNEQLWKEVETKKRVIDQIERQADLESELNDRKGHLQPNPNLSDDPKERKEQQKLAVEAYMRFGAEGLSEEGRAIIMPNTNAARAAIADCVRSLKGMSREVRDLATTTSGAVLPNEYWDDIEKSMLAFGGMREISRTIRTATGNSFIMPTMNDTANAATLVTEAGTSAGVDPTLSSLTLGAFTYRSRINLSREMLQDASFNVDAWVLGPDGLSQRLARGLNTAFTTGDGSSKPLGVMVATSSGLTINDGTAINYNDFVDLEHAVDPVYRRNGRYMFHDDLLKSAKKIKDTQNNPIWMSGLTLRAPDTILGYPYTVNQDVAQLNPAGGAGAAGDKVMAFGDFTKYIIRDVVGDGFPVILRLIERYAELGQVAFLLFSRHDGDLLDAGTDPIKHAITPS